MALSVNSAQMRDGVSGSRRLIVVASMSTPKIAVLPSAVTITIAWRWRISGCEGTTKPVRYAKFSGEQEIIASRPADFMAATWRSRISLRIAALAHAVFLDLRLIHRDPHPRRRRHFDGAVGEDHRLPNEVVLVISAADAA